MVGRCWLFWLFVVGAPLWAFGGCTSTEAAGGDKSRAGASSTAVPANYRQLVARHILTKVHRGAVLRAEISRPGIWVGPFGLGTPRPIACAKWTAQGQFIQQDYTLGFTFEGGRIEEVFGFSGLGPGGMVAAATKNAYTCGKLTYARFPELMKRK